MKSRRKSRRWKGRRGKRVKEKRKRVESRRVGVNPKEEHRPFCRRSSEFVQRIVKSLGPFSPTDDDRGRFFRVPLATRPNVQDLILIKDTGLQNLSN